MIELVLVAVIIYIGILIFETYYIQKNCKNYSLNNNIYYKNYSFIH